MKQHSSRTSKCRLVRNAIRRYGVRKFTIEPIVRCHSDDADANESYYIMANKTLYPHGYNLRHGSKAGDESAEDMQMMPSVPNSVTMNGARDELRAFSDASADLADLCDEEEEVDKDEDRLELLEPVGVGSDWMVLY